MFIRKIRHIEVVILLAISGLELYCRLLLDTAIDHSNHLLYHTGTLHFTRKTETLVGILSASNCCS